MKKIVLAFDSFKGSVSAWEITQALQQAIIAEWKDMEVVSFPIADGGEGTSALLARTLDTDDVYCKVHDPLMRPIFAHYALAKDQTTAIMDMASAAGLPLLSNEERNPMITSTFGVGEMVLDAIQRGCSQIILGLGGSATNDAGTGMLAALGVVFRDRQGNSITPCGKTLKDIDDIDVRFVHPSLNDVSFTLICDVNNPFCGPNGAASVFAPQKGADAVMVDELNEGMKHYGECIQRKTGMDIFP